MKQTNTWRKSTTLETVEENLLLKQDWNTHHVTCVTGSTSNQGSTTRAVSKCQKWYSDCFDTILQYFEKKTEQSESGHRCFIQNSRLLRIGPFEHGSNFCTSGAVKRLQYCVNRSSAVNTILYHRGIQGHSGGEHVDSTLQDNVLLPSDFTEHIYHAGSSHDLHSITQSGLILFGKDVQKGRHAVFFTSVNPMFIDHCRERDYDVTKPRIAVYKHNWKTHQNTAYWCVLRVAQSKGLQFYQARSNAIILYNTLRAVCIEKVVIRKSEKNCTVKRINPLLYRKNCTQTEFALWTPGYNKLWRENIFRPFQQSQGNLWRWNVQRKWSRWNRLKDQRIAPFGCPRARSLPQGSSQ